jgi:muramoyltetrapeptide carboxypeptidase
LATATSPALLNSIHARTGLVTFHGPNGGGRWDSYSLDWTRRVLFAGEAVTFSNPKTTNDRNVLTQSTIASGPSHPARRGAGCSAET